MRVWPQVLFELAEVVDEVSVSDAASTRLSWAIWGLLALAGAISVATVIFWWLTRPSRDAASVGAVKWVGPGDGDTA